MPGNKGVKLVEPVTNAIPPIGVAYQSTVSPSLTMAQIPGTGLPEQYSISPPLTGDVITGQSQSGAVTDNDSEQLLPSFTVKTMLVPDGTPLIDHSLAVVLTTRPDVLSTEPELTVTITE